MQSPTAAVRQRTVHVWQAELLVWSCIEAASNMSAWVPPYDSEPAHRHSYSQLIQTRRLRFFGQVASLEHSGVNLRAAQGLEASCGPAGRPRHTWLCTLDADLQPHNFGLNSAWKYAQYREHLKHLVETAMLQLGACAWWWWWLLLLRVIPFNGNNNKNKLQWPH